MAEFADWTKEVIKKKCEELSKEQLREFTIAYAELPEKYHGYLQPLPQKIKLWNSNVPEEFYKELRKMEIVLRQMPYACECQENLPIMLLPTLFDVA